MLQNSRSRIFLIVLALISISIAFYFLFLNSSGPAPAEDPANLLGTWERTDYPYHIEVSSYNEDGSLDAIYLNPNPINVGTAKWEVYESKLYIYVEMQDINYPGSNYTLMYDPDSERLSGTYIQAVTNESFSVTFTKVK